MQPACFKRLGLFCQDANFAKDKDRRMTGNLRIKAAAGHSNPFIWKMAENWEYVCA